MYGEIIGRYEYIQIIFCTYLHLEKPDNFLRARLLAYRIEQFMTFFIKTDIRYEYISLNLSQLHQFLL